VLSFAFLSFCIFKGRVLLYSSGWPWTWGWITGISHHA
jgi:hypothetical protein